MNEPRTAAETIAALSQAVRREHVKQKSAKSKKTGQTTQIDYIEWHTAVRLLNEICPDWNGRVTQIVSEAGRVAVVYEIAIPCSDAVITRQAIGNEDDDMEGYGDPFSNAEAMAFKRAAAKFGLALNLYRKGAPLPPSQNAPQEPVQASREQINEILNLCGTEEGRLSRLVDFYHVKGLSELTDQQAQHAIRTLRKQRKEAGVGAEQ